MERSIQLASLVFSGLLIFSTTASAEAPVQPVHTEVQAIEGEGVKAGIMTTTVVQRTAKVIEINYVERTLVLEASTGKTIDLTVNEDIKNFKMIQTGDLVTVEYLESIALFATVAGLSEKDGVFGAVAIAAEGEMPAGIKTETMKITALVEAIDYETYTVTLKGPEGIKELQVDKSAKRFTNIKKGDEVHFVYSKAVAISVTKAEENKE